MSSLQPLCVDQFVLWESALLTTQIMFFLRERTKNPHTTEDILFMELKVTKGISCTMDFAF